MIQLPATVYSKDSDDGTQAFLSALSEIQEQYDDIKINNYAELSENTETEKLYNEYMEKSVEDAVSLSSSVSLYAASYYPGTNIPTYSYVSGRSLITSIISDDGSTCSYFYSYNVEDHVDYAYYLINSYGWELYDSITAADNSYVMWFLVKNGVMISIVADFSIPATIVMVPTPTKIEPTKITLNQSTCYMVVGDTYRLCDDITPEDAETTISWSSSNSSVVSVSTNGTIKANKMGTAMVTAKTSNGLTSACTVKVINIPNVKHEKIHELYEYILTHGETITSSGRKKIEATTYADDGVTYTAMIRDDSNPNNLFFALTYDYNGASILISFAYDMTTQKVNGNLHASFLASTTYYYADAPLNVATIAEDSHLAFVTTSTNNPSFDPSELFSLITQLAFCAWGDLCNSEAGIGLTDLGFYCFPNGWVAVDNVALTNTSASMFVGDTLTLSASVTPVTASLKNVRWESSNPAVASVENGTVTAKAPGTANIIVTTIDGAKTAVCSVTIAEKIIHVEEVKIDKTEATVYEGETFSLNAVVLPEKATNKRVNWSSNNTDVAVVNNGVVTAVSAGTANISAMSEDGGKKAVCTVTVKPLIPEIKINSKYGCAGKTVKVDITFMNNPGIALLGFKVNYDKNVMTLKSVQNGIIFDNFDGNAEKNPFSFIAYNDTANEKGNGTLVTLEFEIKEDCPNGDYDITISDVEIININEQTIDYVCENGKITVRDFLSGDVTGDFVINRQDLLRLAKYFAGWDVEIDEMASDVTADGNVNRQDLLRLAKYFAGWDVALG
ncbi:MAG: Ig-like domain-containing protein, partial [Clostridia bacterium]|nr:Ig-like domain-containing protein [Clostridia bacterium]